MADQQTPRTTGEPRQNPTTSRIEVVASAQLFRGAKVVLIEHNGERYQLRMTSRGKLILTK